MKKIVSFCLALALVMSLGITAFAADETDVGTGSYSTAVTGSTVNGTTGGTVFMVDITWTGLNFTYHGAKEPTWDSETHTYTDRVAAWWEGTGSISIVNDSNTRIYAAPTYEAATGYEDADMVFSTNKLRVASAEYGTQQSGTITVTPTGSLPNDTQSKTIGTITVTIAEDPDVTVEEAAMLVAASRSLCRAYDQAGYCDSNSENYDSALDSKLIAFATATEILNSTYVDYLAGDFTQEQLNSSYTYLAIDYAELLANFNALEAA